VLRVLDLEGTEGLTDHEVENIVRRLPRLKFLSLRRCTHIFRLPESLGCLRQLETLDVRHTAVARLPDTFVKLKKLQYVRTGSSPSQDVSSDISANRTWISACLSCSSKPAAGLVGVEMPLGIGELTNLHTLGVITATVAGLKELKKLTQLRKLGVSGINHRTHMKLRDIVSGHDHLESLSIWLDKDTEGIELCAQTGVFLFPDKLQRLKLHGHVDRLPEWIRVLSKLPGLEVCPLQDPVLMRQLSNFQDGIDDQEIEEASSESQASSEETI
jgi:hypothetical protein